MNNQDKYFLKCNDSTCTNCVNNHGYFSGFTQNSYKTRRGYRNDALKLNFNLHNYTYSIGSVYNYVVGITITGSINCTLPLHYFCKRDKKWIELYSENKIEYIRTEINRKFKNGTYPRNQDQDYNYIPNPEFCL